MARGPGVRNEFSAKRFGFSGDPSCGLFLRFWGTPHTEDFLFARMGRVFTVDEKLLTLGVQSPTEPSTEARSVVAASPLACQTVSSSPTTRGRPPFSTCARCEEHRGFMEPRAGQIRALPFVLGEGEVETRPTKSHG